MTTSTVRFGSKAAVVRGKGAVLMSLSVVYCLLMVGCQARSPNGKYVAHVHLPTGAEWIETVDFRSDGICYFGVPPTIAECHWSREGNKITISRNGVVLSTLQFDGKQLVDSAAGDLIGPFVRGQGSSR